MANDDFSEPPRRADSQNCIFISSRILGPGHLRGSGVSLGRIFGGRQLSPFGGGGASQRAVSTPSPRSCKPAHPSPLEQHFCPPPRPLFLNGKASVEGQPQKWRVPANCLLPLAHRHRLTVNRVSDPPAPPFHHRLLLLDPAPVVGGQTAAVDDAPGALHVLLKRAEAFSLCAVRQYSLSLLPAVVVLLSKLVRFRTPTSRRSASAPPLFTRPPPPPPARHILTWAWAVSEWGMG